MAVSINERAAVKKLVGVANSEVWYEMSAGTMIELNIASGGGAINTADQLNMFEGFQKAFIVNGGYLRVADFANIKLTHTALTTAHAKGDILTQDTNNTMVVDFTNSTKTATYGYVTGGTWECTNAVTGSGSGSGFTPTGINGMLTHTALDTVHPDASELTQGTAKMTVQHTDAAKTHTWGVITAGTFNTDDEVTGDGGGTAFTPTATDTSPPVWHAWTVYPGGASGTMPSTAYLGCLYRGRCVLSGNPDYPHQWYMSKIGDPWDWAYSSTDPLTAVAGNNADAGEIGDVIRALIPYKDDYLIFGCASTIWLLTGDPAHGGSIDEVDGTVGMFGANSWCFDGEGNLYFFGTGGIYRIPLGFRNIENLTEVSIPTLVADEAANPSTHRITMEYDRKRHGILVCITKLSDGSNSNYWYDLKLKGFFPEDYPNTCGAYSLFYYAANNNTYADLLVGSKDGYIRKFDETSEGKNDDIGGSTQLINSYAVWPIHHLAEDSDKEGKMTSLTIELAGGGTGGDFGDTDAVTYKLYTGKDAETVIEKMKATTAWATATEYAVGTLVTYGGEEYICIVAHTSEAGGATHEEPDTNTTDWELATFTTGTLTGTGRKARIRSKVRGAYLGIKLVNSTASQSWAINKIYGDIKEVGRIR